MTSAVMTVTQEQVGTQVRTALAEKLRIEPEMIRGDDKLQELPGADSVRLLQVVAQIERYWGLELEDAEIFRPHTFDGLVELVWSRVERLARNDA